MSGVALVDMVNYLVITVLAALIYFWVTVCAFPFLGIYNAAAAQFCSMGRANMTMYVSLMMNAINIVGDFIGVSLLHAGVLGVAVPMLVFRGLAALVMSGLSIQPGKFAPSVLAEHPDL